MNPRDEKEAGFLFRAAETSYRNHEPFRRLIHSLAETHAGSGYGQNRGDRFETMLNLMNQTVDAYTMSLVANRPRVLLTTRYPELKFFAKKFELGLNNLIEEIRLEETLARWVLDAFFGVGIIKVHLANSAPVQLEQGIWMDPGIPFASNIPLDNFVFDASATVWQNVRFAADWYRIPFEDLKSDLYDQEAVSENELQPSTKGHTDPDRLERISRGEEVDQDEFTPMIDVADFWVPQDGKIYTWAIDPVHPFRGKGLPIAEMDWDGPEFGPYHLLGFGDVPENIMPTSPASHLSSLEKLINNLMRKGARQAKRQKQVNLYSGAGAETAKKMQRASDGEWIMATDPNEVKGWRDQGVDPTNHQFMMGCIEMFDRMAGNLSAMLGLGAQADTLGQEKLIHGAVSSKEAKMQLKVLAGTTRLIRDLGWLLWQDKVRVQPGMIPLEGAPGYEIDATWSPDHREGDFPHYNFNIDVYSMPYQSPEQRAQSLMMVMQQFYFPLEAQIVAQGGMIDIQELSNVLADLTNQPYLKEIVKFLNVVPDPAESPQSELGGKPANTTRSYIQKRAPADGTPAGRAAAQQDAWSQLASSQSAGGQMVPAA